MSIPTIMANRYICCDMTEREAMEKVLAELMKAEKKHPSWPSDILHQIAIVNEESGEATRAALQLQYEGGEIHKLETELIQTAAMCIRMLKNLKG